MFTADHNLEDVYFTENAERYPADTKQKKILSDKYVVL